MQLEALKTRIKTTHNVISEEADAREAGYASHDAATTTASFTVPYPETIFRETAKLADAGKGGVQFTPSFSTADVFEGDAEYSCKTQMLNILSSNRSQHQAAIDAKFPGDQPKHAKARAICLAILRQG